MVDTQVEKEPDLAQWQEEAAYQRKICHVLCVFFPLIIVS